jgi:phosphotransferase system  glucose/maltose/N-acetylglucosamine-specific IIC component
MVYVLLWLFFAIMIGAAASSRGRSGFGWFLLAAVISPLLSGAQAALVTLLTAVTRTGANSL